MGRRFGNRFVMVAAALAVLVVVLGVVSWRLLAPGGGAGGTALVGGPFTLTDQAGKEVTEQDFKGRFMLIYFGYTYCPDFCPMTLSTMVQALDLLAPEQAEKVVPIMITIDPARDTVAQLANYVPLFSERLVGLTGSAAQIEKAAKEYRVYFNKVEQDDPDAYLMDHSTFIYLMGPDGAYRRHFGADAKPEEIADGIRAELAQG
jgi:cytochrome oxidase Cu insertion factor (SCO1/SenC/PrrC family)